MSSLRLWREIEEYSRGCFLSCFVGAAENKARSMSGRNFVLIVVDRDTSEFTVEGPMTDDHPWNIAAANAHYLGRNIRCFGMGDITPAAAAAEWQAAFGGKRLAAGSIVSPQIHTL